MAVPGSTSPHRLGLGRRVALAGAGACLAGCAARPSALPTPAAAPVRDGAFVMPDGGRLPFRSWRPATEPQAVVLALHGYADSRDAFEWPAPVFAAYGVAVVAPDQRGFGETAERGHWAGTDRLVADVASVLGQVQARYPGAPVYLLGESMGGAVAMVLAARRRLPVAGIVLTAPAVWGRAHMGVLLRSGLFMVSHALPWFTVQDGGPVRVRATDNLAALRRLSHDPLTSHGSRLDALRGMVDLMDEALAAARALPAPTLVLYGGRDEVIPPAATAAMWRTLPASGVRRAFYPDGYHLLLRDHAAPVRIGDILAWMRDPAIDLPAEAAAGPWLATQA